jgi:hypothetical protein
MPRITDATGGSNRHLHSVNYLRRRREQSKLCGNIITQEHATMAAGLESLRDHGVTAVRFQKAHFGNRGRRAKILQPDAVTRFTNSASGKP